MKKQLAIIALMACAMTMSAQVEKNIIYRVAAGNITYTEPVKEKESVGKVVGTILTAVAGSNTQNHPEFAEQVRAAIIGGIGGGRRLRVIDGQFQPGEVGDDEEAFYIDGNISSITTTSQTSIHTDSKGHKHSSIEYRGNITATVNIKKVNTDEILSTFDLNTGEYSLSWIESPQKALGKAVKRMSEKLTNAVNMMFPLYASIIEGSTTKKDKQKEVYIDLGTRYGAYKGMTFHVYSVKVVAGHEAKKEIGRLKISEVEGEDISLCKVTRGGADIKECIDKGVRLLIMTRD